MNIEQELHWHEGLFLCPHHLQQFQREISKGFMKTIHSIFDFPYGMVELEIDNERLNNENIIDLKSIKALMPSGYYINSAVNCYIPPFTLLDKFGVKDKTLTLYLGLPFWGKEKANLSSRKEIKNDKISRIYSITDSEYTDENTGYNNKTISMRKLNPKIFSSEEDHVDYEVIPFMRLKRIQMQKIVMDNEFAPSCFKISGSPVLRELVKNTIIYLVNHTNSYKEKLHNLYEFKNSPVKLQIPIHKLRIISSYSAELNEIFSRTNPTPFKLYIKLKKLLAELSTIIPEFNNELLQYDHDNAYFCFSEIYKRLKEVLKIELIMKNYIKLLFSKDQEENYILPLSKDNIDEHFDYFISIKTKIPAEYLINKVEQGASFKCIPSSNVKMQAIPGFKLNFVSNVSEEIFREQDEYYFIIKKSENKLLNIENKIKEMTIINKLDREEGTIDEINMVVLYGKNK